MTANVVSVIAEKRHTDPAADKFSGSTDVGTRSWLRGWPPAVRMVLGATVGVLAALVTSGVGLPDTGSTYILLYPVVFACAYLAGRDSGVSATGAGALVFLFQLVRSWSQNPFRFQHLASLLLFSLIGTGTAVLLSHLRRARNQAEQSAAAALKSRNEAQRAQDEADLLLRELSHRVKNDVANLVAILRLQAGKTEGPAAAQLITAADRLIVLSRVHQRLSRHGHSALVELGDFLEQLCADLESTLVGVRAISLTWDIGPARVTSGEAVALGLIINEMLTNSVKYAFPNIVGGKIHLSVHEVDGGTLRAIVQDDGQGFDTLKATGGLGRKLIQSLTAQLDGTYECVSGPGGTQCTVRFESKMYRPRLA